MRKTTNKVLYHTPNKKAQKPNTAHENERIIPKLDPTLPSTFSSFFFQKEKHFPDMADTPHL